MNLTIATRKSKLAQVQTDKIISLLNEKENIKSEKLLVMTEGDRRLDISLNKIGGKGLFVKEIELALLNKNAHAAVHSLKDVPFELSSEFELVSFPEREDIRDAFVSMNGLKIDELGKGARIGTSSIRRAEQLKLLKKDIEVIPIRGNVQTRIKKIEEENLDGIILAAAGLKRLGMECIITDYFNPMEFIPAVSQGALAIECLKDGEYNKYFAALDNKEVRLTVEAERSFMKTLNGGCHSLIGAYSEIKGNDLYIIGIFDIGGKIIKKDILGNKENNIELGYKLAQKIISAV